MREAGAPETQEPIAAPLRRSAGRSKEQQDAWASKETVPLRVATERAEADERAARLCIVTGRRSRGWWA